MQLQGKSDIMLTVRDGFLICPNCKQNKKLQVITPDMAGTDWPLYCRSCKHTTRVDVIDGQCYLSRSR